MRRILKVMPELYFMGLGVLWAAENYLTNGTINYIALLITWLLFLQLFYKNRILGLIYGVILALISVYMILAVNSEVSDFGVLSWEAIKMQLIGWTVFGVGLLSSGAMLYKFATAEGKYSENELTISF